MTKSALRWLALLVFCVATTHPPLGFAHQDPLPPVNERSILGIWEAISEEDLRVFRLHFFQADAAFLAVAIPNLNPMLFRLHTQAIVNGRCDFVFREVQGNYEIRIEAKGVAGDGTGHLAGKLVMKLTPPPDSSWSVRFIKLADEPYIEQVHRLSQAAKEAISKARLTR
jgi:hypothetical protein